MMTKKRIQRHTMRQQLVLLGAFFLVPAGSESHSCKICKDGGTIGNPDGLVTSFNGQSTSCVDLEVYAMSLPERSCQTLQSLALVPCECPGFNTTTTNTTSTSTTTTNTTTNSDASTTMDTVTVEEEDGTFVCLICGEGEMTNPAGLALNAMGRPTTCQTLHENRRSISESACGPIQSFARLPCGCSDGPTSTQETNLTDAATDSLPIVCSLCGEGGRMRNPNGVVVNSRGQQRRCSALEDNVVPQSVCASVQEMARGPCGCTNTGFGSTTGEDEIPFLCSICGDGSVVTNPQGIVSPRPGQTVRCGALEANAQAISQGSCSTLQLLAREACGCTKQEVTQLNATTTNETAVAEDTISYQCSICNGGEMTIPQGIVTSRQGNSARCDVLMANSHTIPKTACSNVQALAEDPCGCILPVNTNTTVTTDLAASDVERCVICGDGEMTYPTGIVTTPQGQSARCSALEANAISIPMDKCSSIQALASEPCGCTLPSEGEASLEEGDSTVCKVCGEGRQVSREGKMITTSMGMFTCSGAQRAGLMGKIPSDHCDSVSISVNQECGCYANGPTAAPSPEPFSCSICGDGRIVTTPEVILVIEGGADSMSCGQYEAAGLDGGVNEDQCPVLQEAAAQVCGCKEPQPVPTASPTLYQCPICGQGRVIGLPQAEVVLPNTQRMSCAGLEQRSKLGIIQEPQCIQITPFVQESCGCVDQAVVDPTEAPTAFECNICGDGMRVTDPEGVVVIPTQPDRTCSELEHAASVGNINANQCRLLHPFVLTPCGCTDEDSVAPSDTPSLFPTAPTISPAPSTVMMRDDCFADLGDIYALERDVEDTSVKRKYVLCPGRTFQMGVWTDDGEIKDGEPFLALRPNVVYQCGQDGSRFNNCILRGGDFGVASYYGLFEGIYETVPGVEIHGVTFESQNLFSVLLQAAGDITFFGCAFKGNNNNAPILMQWDGEGPEDVNGQLSAALEEESPSQRHLQVDSLRHVVTFQDCVFRDNFVDNSMSFPGVIENSFDSELFLSNCLFQDNVYGDDQNPATYGYAIRSFGPISLNSTCFIDNVFLTHGPVLIYGNQYSVSNNYVKSSQNDLSCEFLALFNEQDDCADESPTCELSDADTCSFSQAPTIAPTQGETTAAPSKAREEPKSKPTKAPTSKAVTSASSAASRTSGLWSVSSLASQVSVGLWIWIIHFH